MLDASPVDKGSTFNDGCILLRTLASELPNITKLDGQDFARFTMNAAETSFRPI